MLRRIKASIAELSNGARYPDLLAAINELAAAPVIPPAQAAAGWKLVPIKATAAMREAASQTPGMIAVNNILASHAIRIGYMQFPGEGSPLEQAWAAMLAAAPEGQS